MGVNGSQYSYRNRSLPRPPGPPVASTDEHYQLPNVSNGYLVPVSSSHQYNYIEPQQQDGSVSPSGDDLNEFSDPEEYILPYQCECFRNL